MWSRRSGGAAVAELDEGASASRAGTRVRGPVDGMSIIYRGVGLRVRRLYQPGCLTSPKKDYQICSVILDRKT